MKMICYFEKSTGTIIGEVEHYHLQVKNQKAYMENLGKKFVDPHNEEKYIKIEIIDGKIPKEVDGVAVKSIGDRAFRKHMALQYLELPEGIEKIGALAFEETGIKTVVFPNSLKIIHPKAFYRCNNLVQVSFGNQLEEIGTYAFASTNIQRVVLPRSVKYIGQSALSHPANIRRELDVQYEGTTEK